MVKYLFGKDTFSKNIFYFWHLKSLKITVKHMNSNWWNKVYSPIILALVFVVGMSVGRHFLGGGMLYSPSETGKIEQILEYIEKDYVDSVNLAEMEKQAIEDLIDNLDPHSAYITQEDYHQVVDPLLGNFDGIGIQFRMIRDSLTVMLPLEGGPSIKAGLKAGDKIVIADGDTIAGQKMNSSEIVKRLKGPRGSEVQIQVLRSRVDSLLRFDIIRDKIPTYSLDASFMINESLGYIKISRFAATTIKEFDLAMARLISEGLKSLILDLRGNSGGYLRAAIEMSDTFLENEKLIVYTKGKNRPEKKYFAMDEGVFEQGKLLILMDENSASASEIVAGAIQDNDRGVIMGRRSFGKGLVQEQMDFEDGSALRLTVARYYTPTGRSIQRPYEDGKDAYYADHYHRMLDDITLQEDSLKTLIDTTKYITSKGHVLYGGGGIMPDIEVPLDTNFNYYFYNRLARNSIIVEYGIDYFNQNPSVFDAFDGLQDFSATYNPEDRVYEQIIKMAKDQEIKMKDEEIKDNKTLVLNTFKAEIARLLFGEKAYFYVYLQKDDIYQKAVEHMIE